MWLHGTARVSTFVGMMNWSEWGRASLVLVSVSLHLSQSTVSCIVCWLHVCWLAKVQDVEGRKPHSSQHRHKTRRTVSANEQL